MEGEKRREGGGKLEKSGRVKRRGKEEKSKEGKEGERNRVRQAVGNFST